MLASAAVGLWAIWLGLLPAGTEAGGPWINQIAGPFRILPGHFERCPDELRPTTVYFRQAYSGWRDRKNVDTWYYSWNCTSYFTATDDFTAYLNLASWSARGGWKDNAFVFALPRLCTAARTLSPSMWRRFMVAVFRDPDATCPFPPGYFAFSNMSSNFDVQKPPSFFYGKWRATLQTRRTSTQELFFCARAYGETVPKLSPQEAATTPPGPGHIQGHTN